MRRIALLICGLALSCGGTAADPQPGTGTCVTSANVTSPGFYFSFDGGAAQNPTVTVCKGTTVTFHVSTSSIHPFCIWNPGDNKSAPGVTNNCISSGDVVWQIPADFSTGARYVCNVHFFEGKFAIK